MDVTFSKLRKKGWFDEVAGLLLLLFTAITISALASYNSADPTWFQSQPFTQRAANWTGRVGATLAELLLQLLGTAAFLVPVVLAVTGWNRFRGKSVASSYGWLRRPVRAHRARWRRCLDLLYGAIRLRRRDLPAGGYVGAKLAGMMTALMNPLGAMLVTATLLAATIVVTTRFSFASAAVRVGDGMGGRLASGRAWIAAYRENRRREAQKKALEKKHAKSAAERQSGAETLLPVASTARAVDPARRCRTRSTSRPRGRRCPHAPRSPAHSPPKQQQLLQGPPAGGYALPPLELLNDPTPQEGENEKDLLARAQLLTDKFHEFAVDGKVVAIHPGPVVTTFEFAPEAGVRYSKIVGLVDDLCLGLKAESIRIDRIPGRSTVGIEVPNKHQEVIFPRELLASEKFRHTKSKLTLALGKDINGDVFTAELERMPHLLIAGATGAGKSVGLNGMITSILYKATPAEVRFIMIDTKMIELGMYAEIPHLLIPVVTDPKHASTALKWAVREMEQRYKKLASVGVRNIEQFNQALVEQPGRTLKDDKTGEDDAACRPSLHRHRHRRDGGPHDGLLGRRRRVDHAPRPDGARRRHPPDPRHAAPLGRRHHRNDQGQLPRPHRVSGQPARRLAHDHRPAGAEHLIGRGDMLFLPSGSGRLLRLHSGYITETELNRIVAFLKKQAKPVYDESVLKDPEEARDGAFEPGDRDAMYIEAVKLVLQEGMCSITLIQRRMRLGYARAARIVDMMEQEGIVGPADGSKPRDLLVGPEILETLSSVR